MPIQSLSDTVSAHEIGGKARSLGKLMNAGFIVPAGFVVSGNEAPESILGWFDDLAVPFVAVRSSASSEDGKEATWAGQLETFLNVDRTTLLGRIADCMQSLRSARAQAYAAHKDVAAGTVAVIVQVMIDSDISGVAFSYHPVTQSAEHMVIEAGLGLGEAVVSGAMTPDTYIVEVRSNKVTEAHISTQSKLLHRNDAGKTDWRRLEPVVTTPKLSTNQLLEVSKATKAIAALYGFPVDIEWAFADNQLYILQARPITTVLS